VDPFQLENSGFSLYGGVRNLLPGHYLIATNGYINVHKWWETLDHHENVPLHLNEQADRFRDLFEDACRIRMRSDVPIGTSLSGGLDSSSVVAVLGKLNTTGVRGERYAEDWQKTFIHTFEGTALDETAYANIIADASGAQKIYVKADQHRLMEQLDNVLYAFESIYNGMPDGAWRIYEAQRQNGVIVSLDGHGGDEMLGGYGWHVSARLHDMSIIMPQYWEMLRLRAEMSGRSVTTSQLAMSALNEKLPLKWIKSAIRKVIPNLMSHYLTDDGLEAGTYQRDDKLLPESVGQLEKTLYSDFHYTVLPRILRNYDLMSMAHGVEVRMPFLDYRLVNFCFSLPATSKIGNGYTKLVLREAMRGILPEAIRARKSKIGFNSPMLEWFRSGLGGWIEETLSGESTFDGLIDTNKLREIYDRRIKTGHFNWSEAIIFWRYLSAIRLGQIMKRHGISSYA